MPGEVKATDLLIFRLRTWLPLFLFGKRQRHKLTVCPMPTQNHHKNSIYQHQKNRVQSKSNITERRLRHEEEAKKKDNTHPEATFFAIAKYTVLSSNSTLHFQISQSFPDSQHATHSPLATSQHSTFPLFVHESV